MRQNNLLYFLRRVILFKPYVQRGERLCLPERFLNDFNLKIAVDYIFDEFVAKLVVESEGAFVSVEKLVFKDKGDLFFAFTHEGVFQVNVELLAYIDCYAFDALGDFHA